MTNGRLEKELKAETKTRAMLAALPEIYTEFYYSMRASKKSYTTMIVYLRYVKNFMDFVTHNKPSNDFYKTVTSSDIEQYLISLETREVNGQIVRTGDNIQATRWSALNTFFNFLISFSLTLISIS
jgi:site-specific recombinase XerD